MVKAIGAGKSLPTAQGTLRFTRTRGLCRARGRRRGQPAARPAAHAEHQHLGAARRAPVPQVLPPPARRHQPGIRGRPLPHRGGALPALRAAGRRGRVRVVRQGIRHGRAAAGLRAEPGRRLGLHARLPGALPRGARRAAQNPHGGYLSADADARHAHRRAAPRLRAALGRPGVRARAARADQDFEAWKAKVREEANDTLALLENERKSAAAAGADAPKLLAFIDACAAPKGAGAQDAPPRRLPPRPGADRQQRLRDHRLRGRAVAPAGETRGASTRRCATWPACCARSATRSGAREPGPRPRTPAAWTRGRAEVRRAFLAAYAEAEGSGLYAARTCGGLLRLFELEKVLYELRYEINNRPAWIHVPLRGRDRHARRRTMNTIEMSLEPLRGFLLSVGDFLPRLALAAAGAGRRLDRRQDGALRHRQGPARGQLQRAHRARRHGRLPARRRHPAPTPPTSWRCCSTGW